MMVYICQVCMSLMMFINEVVLSIVPYYIELSVVTASSLSPSQVFSCQDSSALLSCLAISPSLGLGRVSNRGIQMILPQIYFVSVRSRCCMDEARRSSVSTFSGPIAMLPSWPSQYPTAGSQTNTSIVPRVPSRRD